MKTFFKYAVLVLSLAAFQACNDNVVDEDILDPDVPLSADVYPSVDDSQLSDLVAPSDVDPVDDTDNSGE